MNTGLLTKKCDIVEDVDSRSEFRPDPPRIVFRGVQCDLDMIIAPTPQPVATPATMQGREQGTVFIADSRLGRLPNRKFDVCNKLVIDGEVWQIAQIKESVNKLTGELDHFEVQVYAGLNRGEEGFDG
jgi:hypothetical protein